MMANYDGALQQHKTKIYKIYYLFLIFLTVIILGFIYTCTENGKLVSTPFLKSDQDNRSRSVYLMDKQVTEVR